MEIYNSMATIADTIFWGNTSAHEGGGLLIWESDGVSVERVVIANNRNPGKLYCGGGGASVLESSNVTFDRVVVSDNDLGGLCISGSPGVGLDNVLIVGTPREGGIQIQDGGSLVFNNGMVVNNHTSSNTGGGGVLAWWGSASMSNVILTKNAAPGGAGACLWYSSLTLANGSVAGNTTGAGGGGGGIHLVQGAASSLNMTNVDVSRNQADAGGGGVNAGVAGVSYSNAYDNLPVNYWSMTDPTGTNGNISADPLYLDTSSPYAMLWDLHLDVGSPLIDAGDPSLLDPDGSPSDIGAFGGPGAGSFDLDWDGYPMWWQPGPYDHATYPAQGWDCDDLDPDVYPGNGR